MKCLILVIACLVAVQASRVPRGVYRSGNQYGNSGYGSGQSGRYNNGVRTIGVATSQNTGHVEDDFHTATDHHHREDHNVGGAVALNHGAHRNGGQSAFQGGHSSRGGGFRSGITG